jgi:hypothetical protein
MWAQIEEAVEGAGAEQNDANRSIAGRLSKAFQQKKQGRLAPKSNREKP